MVRICPMIFLAISLFQVNVCASANSRDNFGCNVFPKLLEIWKSGKDNLYVAAHMSAECAEAFRASEGLSAKDLFIQSGFPSALFDLVADDDLLGLIEAIVESGDHGYFGEDKKLNDRLKQLNSRGAVDREKYEFYRAFIFATQTPDENIAEALVAFPGVIDFFPVWESEATREEFAAACSNSGCGITKITGSICDSEDYVTIKRRFVSSPDETMKLVRKCNLNLPQILGLRRFGIIDSRCSISMQLEGISELGTALDEPCSVRFMYIHRRASLTENDIVRYFRFLSDPLKRNSIDAETYRENAKAVANYSQKLAEEILKLR